MELQTLPSSPSIYMSAPTSPNAYTRIASFDYFYSAPPSPRQNSSYLFFDDFEFETSKKFEYTPMVMGSGYHNDPQVQKPRERGDSLPVMAFADDLFVNGLVMPLKPPPRLQCDDVSSFSQRSPVLSPKSPKTVCKIPFARKNAWNDNFDPFKAALEKVREEKSSYQMRSQSYSSFMTMSKSDIDSGNQELRDGNSPVKMPLEVLRTSHSGPLDFKGSAYARWVRDQTKEGGITPARSSKRFLFRKKVRPVKTEHDWLEGSVRGKGNKKKGENGNEESKVHKLKDIFMRYALFRRENGGKQVEEISKEPKLTYSSKRSFKSKGNEKMSMDADRKMATVTHKPSFGLCLGHGGASPKIRKIK